IIRSPNMPYIPFLTLGLQYLRLRRDGRFGEADYTLLPQRFAKEYGSTCLIPVCPQDETHSLRTLWRTPTHRD
ncbi:hypothetical protein PLICRDRAFT_76586, partial [Plicaturopsis crispa FD-325 SS-3]